MGMGGCGHGAAQPESETPELWGQVRVEELGGIG
jgi:hypothetical protein